MPGSIRTEKRMVRLLTSFFQAFGAQSTRYVLIHSCLDVPTLCPENHGIIRVIDPLAVLAKGLTPGPSHIESFSSRRPETARVRVFRRPAISSPFPNGDLSFALSPTNRALMGKLKTSPVRSTCQGRFPQAEAFGLSVDRYATPRPSVF